MTLRVDGQVVCQPIHHDLAHDRPDPMLLGRPERRVQAGLVDCTVDHGRGRAGGRERPPCRGGDALGCRNVEVALQREDVALQPGEEIHAGPESRVRKLRQVSVQVDHAGKHYPWSDVGRRGDGLGKGVRGGAGVREAPRSVDDEEAVSFVSRPARGERRQQACPERERGTIRKLVAAHDGEASTTSAGAAGPARLRPAGPAGARRRARASAKARLSKGASAPVRCVNDRRGGQRTACAGPECTRTRRPARPVQAKAHA